MRVVELTSEYAIRIPPEVRKSLGLKPGDKLDVFEHDGRIVLIPVRHPKEMRGLLRGIDTDVPRKP